MLKSTRRRRLRRRLAGKPAVARWHRAIRITVIWAIPVGLVLAINAGMLVGLAKFGIVPFPQVAGILNLQLPKTEAEASTVPDSETAQLVTVTKQASPSAEMMSRLISSSFGGWEVSGSAQDAVDRPLATLCPVTDGIAPVDSRRALYRNGANGDASLTVQVFGAGLAAKQFSREKAQVMSCAPSDSRVDFEYTQSMGNDSFAARVTNQDGSGYRVTAWRDGDVTFYVTSTSSGSSVDELIADVRKEALGFIESSCANPAYSLGDSTRNPWGGQYRGLYVTETVEAALDPVIARGVKPIPEDLRIPKLETVVMPIPPAEPYWPDKLPIPMKRPRDLVVPTFQPPTQTVITRAVEDAQGPGCGWAFTGQSAPAFNSAKADEEYQLALTAARTSLAEQQEKWVAQNTEFWRRYDSYVVKADRYNAYAGEIAAIAAAWDAIDTARQTYTVDLANWRAAKQARLDFIDEQITAQADYDSALAFCAARPSTPSPSQTPTPSPTPTPVPSASDGTVLPSPEPSVTPTPSASPTRDPWADCPPERPWILDQLPPIVPPKPTPPPDPRPKGYENGSGILPPPALTDAYANIR